MIRDDFARFGLAAMSGAILVTVCLGRVAVAQEGKEKPATTAAKIPSSLVGEWFWGTVSPSYYVDKNTGAFLGNSTGGGQTLIFKANGTYQRYVLIQTRLSLSTSEVFAASQGTVTFDESKGAFTLHPKKGEYTFKDGSNTRRRPMEKDELERAGLQFTYRFVKEDKSTYLYVAKKGEKPDEARCFQLSKNG
jgi:hypothetical protein